MKNPELYNRTVDILVQAYFNDTLQHGHTCGCAVGNIVAKSCGYAIEISRNGGDTIISWKDQEPFWQNVFCTSVYMQEVEEGRYWGEAKQQIDSTGYTWQELAQIEHAFEVASFCDDADEDGHKGLMAVVEVLDIIHENKDTQITEDSKKRFDKKALAATIS